MTWFAEVHPFTNATYGVTKVLSRANYHCGADNKRRIADNGAFLRPSIERFVWDGCDPLHAA